MSDPHLGPVPRARFSELMSKRLIGNLEWVRRKHIHNMDALAKIVADMRAQNPDHVMMTGDAVNLGLPDEFPQAAAWMRTLGDVKDVSFTPGNHDAYVKESLPHLQTHLGPWMQGDGGEAGVFPYVRVRHGVALIGVSSGLPTAPTLATGRMGKQQMAFFAKTLALTRARGLMRVVMIHHAPWRGGATPGRGLRDAGAFEKVIAAHGAELIVHGHNHRTSVKHLPGPAGTVPVVGVRSASAVPGTSRHLAGYHLYRIDRIGTTWMIEARARGLAEAGGEVIDLGKIEI